MGDPEASDSGTADGGETSSPDAENAPGESGSSDSGKPAPAARSGGRAGRNLGAAIAVGVVFGVLIVGSLYTVKELFLVVVAVAVGFGVMELARAFAFREITVPVVPVLVGMVAMLAAGYQGGPTALVAVFALTLLTLLVWRMPAGVTGYVKDTTASVFVTAYAPFLAGFVGVMLAAPDGSHRVVVFVAVTVASDIGGYFAGITLGRHRMSPVISPKKTWEGFAGSVVFCVATGVILMVTLLGAAWWQGAVFGAVVVVCATLGDLVESMIKRDLGIKDMSSLLPGHGGLMDRLDSLLAAVVPAWLLLALFVPVAG
ncbi:phosphatidate cytidylyltransferase [Rhizohabitans arisaemae]|uniref:phosphatidate cytidylyltransferase n=1 Tax=Rhizohabitans arisaemae TaxID=2720610 RepID=UPI0024B21CC6|nr:phosphatidate cytidylyltransferase [Rhizohabitans arisaemae]